MWSERLCQRADATGIARPESSMGDQRNPGRAFLPVPSTPVVCRERVVVGGSSAGAALCEQRAMYGKGPLGGATFFHFLGPLSRRRFSACPGGT